MIPPSPWSYSLWGPTLYAELTAGLWRALAAPWLAPPRRARPDMPARATDHALERTSAGGGTDQPPAADAAEVSCSRPSAQVIEVAPARWRQRRQHTT